MEQETWRVDSVKGAWPVATGSGMLGETRHREPKAMGKVPEQPTSSQAGGHCQCTEHQLCQNVREDNKVSQREQAAQKGKL